MMGESPPPGTRDDRKEYGIVQGERVKQIIAATPDSYMFSRNNVNSLVIRCRAGFTSDTRFALFHEAVAALRAAGHKAGSAPNESHRAAPTDPSYSEDFSCPD
jgi:hypothetical protein